MRILLICSLVLVTGLLLVEEIQGNAIRGDTSSEGDSDNDSDDQGEDEQRKKRALTEKKALCAPRYCDCPGGPGC